MNIELIFPTAIAVVDNNVFDDHPALLDLEYNINKDSSNGMFEQTTDTYVLENHVPNLRNWLQQQLDNFSKYSLSTDQKLKFTQSWCLKHNNTRQEVFPHSHPNSIISGAYYVAADEDSAKLKFHRTSVSTHPSIQWEMDPNKSKDAPWNWDWQKISVHTGRLVLFPSQLMHSVESEMHNSGIRCVLSFNTWFEGSIGSDYMFNKLGPL